MLIGVIADTHDHLPALEEALRVFAERGVEAVIHAGDLVAPFAAKRLRLCGRPLFVVYGNNDGERAGLKQALPEIREGPLWMELGGRRILVHHYLDWCRKEDVARADVVVTGHTHEAVNKKDGARLLLNPGECCGWVNGRRTVAILDTNGPSAEVVPLGA